MTDKALSSLTPVSLPLDTGDGIYVTQGGNSRRGQVGHVAGKDLKQIEAITRTRGDLIAAGDTGWERLPIGTAGYHLESDTGGDPVWVGFTQDTGTAATRTWQAKARERISPKDFGAVGDGSTDDVSAIQAAIAYAESLSNASDSDSVLDGVFTVIDCSGATWGVGSTGLQFTNTKNIIILGGRFKAVGTWASAGPIFNVLGASTIAVANLKFQDITIDCDKKANGIRVENAPRTLIVNPRITHQKEYGIEFNDNVWGSAVYEPTIHEWDSDDPELENASLREADGIRLSGLATDVRTISGFIGFNKRGVAILDQAGFGCHFVATHIYDSALVTPQENDLVYAEATTTSTQFISCYFDTGWVHLLGTGDHIFSDCRFYRNEDIAPAGLTAYIHWEATDTNQGILTRLIGNYWQDHSFPIENPIGKFTEDGDNSYAFTKGTFETAARDNWIIREPLSITISSFTPDVLALRSFHSNTFLAFEDQNTTTPPKIGSEGDDLEITVSGDVTINGVAISAVGADLTAIEALSGTGFPTRTAADTWAQRTIAGTSGQITVTNGNGVSGNPTIGLAVTPGFGACNAHRNGVNQTGVTNATNIDWTTEDFDPDNAFDLANNRFLPNVAGYYHVHAQMTPASFDTGTFAGLNIVKNSTVVASSAATGAGNRVAASCVVQLNGTTDAITIPIFTDGTVNISGTASDTFFYAHLARAS